MTSPAAGARASRLAPLLAGLGAGVTAWVSFGAVALVDPARMTRVGGLPSWPWLAALAVAGAALGAVAGRRLVLGPLILLTLPWLPWLPGRVPAAFLLWDGPLEGAVWVAALAGCAWPLAFRAGASAGAKAAGDAWWRSPRRAPWVAAGLFATAATVAWLVARPRLPAGDEPHYLVITQSLLRDGDLRIENNHRDTHYLEYFDGVLKPDFMRRGVDGQIYSIHAPGVSALVLPAFAAAGYAGAVATVVAVGAVGMAALWWLTFVLTGSAGAAWMAWSSVAAAAPMLLHACLIYPDPVGGVLALAGVGALVALDTGAVGLGGRAWLAIGGALAVLPWLHTRFALIAGGLGLAIVLRLWRRAGDRRDVLRFLAVPAFSALAWFAYFWSIYGTPNPAAPYGIRPEGGLSFVPAGVAGLLIDQQFGLLANAPALALAAAGFALLGRERPRLAVELLTIGLSYLVTAASYPMWWGGYSAPARFIVVLVPVLALPLAVLWARGPAAIRGAMAALLAVSAAITAALVGHDRGAFIFNGRDGYGLLLDWLSRSADLPLALPSVHRDGALVATDDAAVWLFAATGVGALAVLAGRLAPPLRRAAAFGSVPVVVMLAATIVWTGRDRDVVTPSTSQMSWLGRWDPDQAPVVVQLSPTRALAADAAPRRLNIATSARGRRGSDEPLLRIPDLPAGEYDLVVEPHSSPAGEISVRLGRQELLMERWRLDDRPPGIPGLVLRLPVDAHSITVSGDAAATAAVRRLALRPRTPARRRTAHRALRAARYGAVVVFGLDDNAYLEPGALWVRGERSASFVVRTDDVGQPAVVRLKAGPTPNEVRLAAGPWSRVEPLEADAEVDVPLPVEALAPSALTVTSATGFRPSALGRSGDVRWLGVYLTWPGVAAPAPGAATP